MSVKMKVLQVHADNFQKGGISKIVWRFMIELQDKGVIFDYLTDNVQNMSQDVIDSVRKYNGNVVYIEKFRGFFIKRIREKRKELLKILSKDYDIVHINGDDILGVALYVLAARKKGKKAVIHAHTTKYSSGNKVYIAVRHLANCILRDTIIKYTDGMVACSSQAAMHMFGKKNVNRVKIIKNGLNPQDYRYDLEKRKIIREKNRTTDQTIIIGHVGRFTYAKNHEFLVALFAEIQREFGNSQTIELWMIGDGELKGRIENLVIEKGCADKVKFIDHTNDIGDYLSAMDVLIFPSRYEGMPLVLIEAQANSLPVICSDVITDEAICSKQVFKCKLNCGYTEWLNTFSDFLNKRTRREDYNVMKQTDFDISVCASEMLKIYQTV